MESLLKKAKELEKKYEWLQATKIYKRASDSALDEKDILKVAEFYERMGFCYFKSAIQAETKSQFNKRMMLAVQTYEKAASFFTSIKDEKEALRIDNSLAMVAYANSWLELDYSKKKEFLDEWWDLKSKVLQAYEKVDDQFGIAKTCNDMMEGSIDCRYWLGSNWKESKRMRDELISLGERSIGILTKIENDCELARAYCWTSWFCHINNRIGVKGKPDEIKKGIIYSKKALELSQKTEDAWLIGWSNQTASNAARYENNLLSALGFLENQIRQGERSRDNLLSGVGRTMLMSWGFLSTLIDEDPEKTRQRHERNIQAALKTIQQFQIINVRVYNYYFHACLAFRALASIELDINRKYSLLRKAVKYGRKSVELIGDWRHSAVPMNLNIYSSALFDLSEIETNPIKKKQLLEELLDNTKNITSIMKAYPYSYYYVAFNQKWIAVAKAELSKLSKDKETKIELLKEAITSIESCIKTIKKDLERSPMLWGIRTHGDSHYWFGAIYYQLYLLTKEKGLLHRAIESYEDAIALFDSLNLTTRVAASYWQKAKIQDQMREYLQAAKDYESASEGYWKAAQKFTQLKGFYENYSHYMLAWNQIEQARFNHSREDYEQAMKHHREAASLHEKSKSWDYLAPNYYAWEQLEKGEDLSRKEEPTKAVESFRLAKEYFKKSEDSIKTKIETSELDEEKELAVNLIKASGLRYRYCNARISLEEAKIYDRKGEYSLSSKSYGKAAENLDHIIKNLESDEEKRELRLIMVLSQAWEKMALAEEQASPEIYLEAAQLFEQAQTYSSTKKTSLLILGNSSICKGLATGIRYQKNLDLTEHSVAKGHLKTAATNYLQAGFKHASEYAKASQRLFDAYVFMNQAESELDQEKRARQYQMAENLLQIAAGSFMKAKQPEKTAQVQQMLENVREEKRLAASLSQVLQAPTIASTTLAFATPTPTSEVSVGLESFEHANVQANLITHVKEVKVGESFCLSVEFVNAGKEPALLTRVEDFIPTDFVVVEKPEIYRLDDNCLNMKGKQLAPLKLVEAKLVLQPSRKGVYQLTPRVHYFDELGRNKSLQLKSVEIKVEEVILTDRVSTGTKELDSILLGGIPEEYAVALTGPPSDEREKIVKSFLEAGIKQNQITFHVTTEPTGLEKLLEESGFYLFLCNPKPKVEVPDLPNIYKLRSKTDLNNLNIALTVASRSIDPKLQGPKRVCVEIVSDVLIRHQVEVTRRWISGLIADMSSKGFTFIAVMNPSMHPSDQANAVLDLFDGEISLFETETTFECKTSIQIKRLRNQDYIKNPICVTK